MFALLLHLEAFIMTRGPGLIILATLLALAACGGGGGGSSTPPTGDPGGTLPPPPPPPPPTGTLSGQFKDGNVEGLAYSTATQAGTTDAAGTFRYRAGETITFRVGAASIGSAPAKEILTPIDLVAAGSSADPAVVNRVRFLLMLDQDGDPDNGIRISSEVRAIAANWSDIDFAAADLGNEVVTILSDVSSVDQRTATLPAADVARSHLESTLYCVMSGVFAGSYTGGSSGNMIALLDPHTGQMRVSFQGGAEMQGTPNPVVDRNLGFEAIRATDSAIVTGRYVDADQLAGTWSIGGQGGDFTATRVFGDPAARLRFTGNWAYGNDSADDLLFTNTFDVDGSGKVSGYALDLISGRPNLGSGQLSQNLMVVNWTSGATGNGTLDPATLSIAGTWTGTNGGTFNARGCRLN